MNLDIRNTVEITILLSIFGVAFGILLGIRSMRAGRRLLYFRKRRELIVKGWRWFFLALVCTGVGFTAYMYAEPTIYEVFPPTPSVTNTPTITVTPSITNTQTITPTVTITLTPAISYTPVVPDDVKVRFTSVVTPNPNTVYSSLQFSREITEDYQPVDPAIEFGHPLNRLYVTFSYDQMLAGAQWSALWYGPDKTLVCVETLPWNGGTGGYGFSECNVPPEEWLPGAYEVQIFNGEIWQISGVFTVTGTPPTSSPSPSPANTATPTITPGPSLTPTPSITPTITLTSTVTNTLAPTRTPRPTDTRWPTPTP